MAGIFSFFLLVYLISAAGYVDTIDAEPSLLTARSLLTHASVRVYPKEPLTMLYSQNAQGSYYSKLGLMMPFLYAPVLWLSDRFSSLLDLPGKTIEGFLISLVNPILLAFCMTLIYWHFRKLEISPKRAFGLVLALGLGTYLWAYSKTCGRDVMQTFCVSGAFIFIHRAERTYQPYRLLLAVAVLSLMGILTKQAVAITLLPVWGLVFCVILRSQQPIRNILVFSIPVILALVALGIVSQKTLGSFWNTGYHAHTISFDSRAWPTPLFSGLYTQTLSLSWGVIFYNPILLFVPIVLWRLIRGRRFSSFHICVTTSIISQALIHAKWPTPIGGMALGPRYLVVIIPLLFLLIGKPDLDRLFKTRLQGYCAAFVLIVFIGHQYINVSIKPQQYWTLAQRAGKPISDPQWKANLIFFKHKLMKDSEIYNLQQFGSKESRWVNLTDVESLRGFNFWWAHLKRQAFPIHRVYGSLSTSHSYETSLDSSERIP